MYHVEQKLNLRGLIIWKTFPIESKTEIRKGQCIIPDDFVTNVKQINSQTDLTSMSSFAGPSYLTVRSSLCIILVWDPCIFNLYNLCQTGSSYLRRKPHQCAFRFSEQIIITHFLLLQPSIRPVPAPVILLWNGPPELCIECHLVPLWTLPPKSPGSSKIFSLHGLIDQKHSQWCNCHIWTQRIFLQ